LSKIVAIDYGGKRTGFAISDDSRIFAFGLPTQETRTAFEYLEALIQKEKISEVVIGLPKRLDNTLADIVPQIKQFGNRIKNKFPEIKIEWMDERFTSKIAMQSMVDSGMRKKDRRNKGNVDQAAATILLQDYLERISR
jgi:putative Holliday junction resolvase